VDSFRVTPENDNRLGQQPPITAGERLPFLTAGGDLSIPFDSPARYHWWNGGQRVDATLAEAGVAGTKQEVGNCRY